jgi:uncharacterized membrane protein YdjX (TVP38/TMEM64 family)/Fe-S oxidoreductase
MGVKMTGEKRGTSPDNRLGSSQLLREKLDTVSASCIGCDLCQKECAFLRKYGKPKALADGYDSSRKSDQAMPFECSLCGLCDAVCPVGVRPADLFLEMRNETVRKGGADYQEHSMLRGYEKRGTSRTFSYYALPEGCETVFFPGCTLSGTRSEAVILTYQRLKEKDPLLGIVLDCCTKPSHDLGREEHFKAMFDEMKVFLVEHGIRRVLVACPNCYKIFARYGSELSTQSVYEVLAQEDGKENRKADETVTIHDPCCIRFEKQVQEAVREIVRKQGISIVEMPHSGAITLCCGEGGGVGFLAPDLSGMWGALRRKEAEGKKVVTYCAGCAGALSKYVPTAHILDVLLERDRRADVSKARVARPPMTYWKRLRLKKWFKENVPTAVSRERMFSGMDARKKGGTARFLIFLLLVVAIIVVVKSTGISRYLEQAFLRSWIESYGALAPIIYVFIYTVAPVLFLPGLPITIVGGVLFGPFWGVIYTISGATLGACLAFLVSRYLARGWVEKQLRSPRWRRLDEGVEKHGWKIVAFTRLIPIFPFNLLNYAFGLTKIGFKQYAVTTFFCMLPACIAFIVFSSSLLDLIRGEVTPLFIIGILLVVLISLFPLFYRRYKARKGEEEPL